METQPQRMYECIVVGGGIAGLQAAIFIHKALLGKHVEICGTPGSDI